MKFQKITFGLIAFIFSALSLACLFSGFGFIDISGLPDWVNGAAGVITAGGIGTAGYFNSSGEFVTRAGASRAVAGNALDILDGATSCGNGGNYTFPNQMTLVADNSAGIADVIFKFTQADNVTEMLIGSIGASWFTVQQFPNEGTIAKQDGTNIFGAESLARSLQTYGVKVGMIQATGSALTSLSTLIIDNWRGNLSGAAQDKWELTVDKDNSSPQLSFKLIQDIDLTSNVSFRVNVKLGTILNLTFFNKGVIPYI